MESYYLFDSLWATVAAFVFIVAMAMGCTADRHYNESPKWIVFVVGLCVLAFVNRDEIFSTPLQFWRQLPNNFWPHAAIYLVLGLGYSVIEFLVDIRRSAKYWAGVWAAFKATKTIELQDLSSPASQKIIKAVNSLRPGKNPATNQTEQPVVEEPLQQRLVTLFMEEGCSSRNHKGYDARIVIPVATADGMAIEPSINRVNLAQSIACWTIWWPFYAISLVVGDLFSTVFEIIAGVVAKISGRFVRSTFKDVFKA